MSEHQKLSAQWPFMVIAIALCVIALCLIVFVGNYFRSLKEPIYVPMGERYVLEQRSGKIYYRRAGKPLEERCPGVIE